MLEIRGISTTLGDAPEQYQGAEDFEVHLAVQIADAAEPGADVFFVDVISTRALQRQVHEAGVLIGRGMVIMERFDLSALRKLLERIMRSCDSNSPTLRRERLMRFFQREEDGRWVVDPK